MPTKFEEDYMNLVEDILLHGELRKGRNGNTVATFAETLRIDCDMISDFPLLKGRKLFYKGVLAEFATMIRQPYHVNDFVRQGCNYWKQWAQPDGSLNLDYGNAWYNYNGVNQMQEVIDSLICNPHGRRHLIDAWRPDRLVDLDLPCCHFLYQWYVDDNSYLHMIWYQRSVDVMIGLPSDIILAAIFNICMAKETGYAPGTITFMMGDCHIYDEHLVAADQYLKQAAKTDEQMPHYIFNHVIDPLLNKNPSCRFSKHDLEIFDYEPEPPIKMQVKS